MSQIQLVLLDVGNVVLRSTHKITEAILWDLGVRPDKAALFFHQPAYGRFARGEITGSQFANRVREVLGVDTFLDAEIRAAHDAHIYAVDRDVVMLLERLQPYKPRVRLAFVTTTNVWQTEREKQLIDLAGRFGPVVRSHDLGKTKADEGAWPTILEQLGLHVEDAPQVLLVDDAWRNLEAAARQLPGPPIHLYDPTPIVGIRKLEKELARHGLRTGSVG